MVRSWGRLGGGDAAEGVAILDDLDTPRTVDDVRRADKACPELVEGWPRTLKSDR